MKKLLFVYDNMMTGGTTTALLSLLQSIDYSDYSVDLLLYTNDGDFFPQIPKQVNLLKQAYIPSKIHALNSSMRKILHVCLNGSIFRALHYMFKYWNTPKGNLRLILMHLGYDAQAAISRSVANIEYDLAIGFIEQWADKYVVSEKVKAKKKAIWIHPDYPSSYLIPEIDKKMISLVDYVVVVSATCKNHLIETFPVYAYKMICIENIISPKLLIPKSHEYEADIDQTKVNLITVCRCDINVKGLDRILDALINLKYDKMLDNVVWHLIGGGNDLNKIKNFVNKHNLQNYVVIYGMMKNPLPYVAKMDLFILSSRYEGKPVSITEALMLGIPCLVTDYASAHIQVTDNYNGIIVDNSDDSIYTGLKNLLNNQSKLSDLKFGAQSSVSDNMNEVVKLYKLI